MPVNILVTLILCLMFLDGTLGRVEGFLLLTGMVLYITCMIRSALRNREEGEVCKVLPLPKSILFMGGGLAASHLRWRSGRRQRLHHRHKLRCQPEFYRIDHHRHRHFPAGTRHLDCGDQKRDSGLALGNAVGSNLFNILFILGMSTAISPLHVLGESVIDCVLLLCSGILLFVFARTKRSMSRAEGAVCVLLYVAYTAYLFVR